MEPDFGPPSGPSNEPSQLIQRPTGWKAKLRALGARARAGLGRVTDKLRSRLSRRGTSTAAAEGDSSGLGRGWNIRERIARIMPADLAKAMPSTFEPRAVAEWLGQVFQKGGAATYGTLATILLSTFFLADLTALLVERFIPEPPPVHLGYGARGSRQDARTLDSYNAIFARNLFNSEGKIPGESSGGPSSQPVELGCDSGSSPSKTALPFNLVGTLIVRNELRSIATIEDKAASAVYPVRKEDEIPGKARIVAVEARKVTFVNVSSGRCEFVELPEDVITKNTRVTLGKPAAAGSKGVERISGTQFNVSRAVVDKSLQDLNKVLTEARAVPNFENGLPSGYKLFQIVPGSIYDTLGLQNGDTICGLNGQAINDPGKAFELLGELKTASNLELCIKRDGKQSNFQYEIR